MVCLVAVIDSSRFFNNIKPLDRFERGGGGGPADQMSVEKWENMLPRSYSVYGEGCNNELLRVFGDIASERRVNTMTSMIMEGNSTYHLSLDWTAHQCAVATQLDIIMARLSQCIVTVSAVSHPAALHWLVLQRVFI
jgi:hypothetical protein